jgi:hypothetical protein
VSADLDLDQLAEAIRRALPRLTADERAYLVAILAPPWEPERHRVRGQQPSQRDLARLQAEQDRARGAAGE